MTAVLVMLTFSLGYWRGSRRQPGALDISRADTFKQYALWRPWDES